MAILKVIEIMANSNTSWEDATRKAVKHASKTVRDIVSVYVQDQSCTIKDGDVDDFRVNVKVTFKIND